MPLDANTPALIVHDTLRDIAAGRLTLAAFTPAFLRSEAHYQEIRQQCNPHEARQIAIRKYFAHQRELLTRLIAMARGEEVACCQMLAREVWHRLDQLGITAMIEISDGEAIVALRDGSRLYPFSRWRNFRTLEHHTFALAHGVIHWPETYFSAPRAHSRAA